MKILYPEAVHHLNRFYVVNEVGDVVQGHYNELPALHAAEIMNCHEELALGMEVCEIDQCISCTEEAEEIF
ncbi:MAG: hypothetical protein K2Z81_17290 [Cyanobacteria bacterium]|nr:hypothetical protein [Cyanobacteriota bacterium]